MSYSLFEFIEFLVSESEAGHLIDSLESYQFWYKRNLSRALSLDLPELPHEMLGVSWTRIGALLERESESQNIKDMNEDNYVSQSLRDLISNHQFENEIPLSRSQMRDITRQHSINSYNDYADFRSKLAGDDMEFCLVENPERYYENWFWSEY
ncbi:hypothetical protein QWY77_06125 [Thalassotalea ponticola]|uniref:hypothetical protein n=1 Tax=Thalassotalea ponticola TaxID=1523392 RepID=UPI0025B34652|nr:hypothetical protein [Thalassotalea ponticola]MDN3652337.1 hypothetical protein [Thalassotalea ponticola]